MMMMVEKLGPLMGEVITLLTWIVVGRVAPALVRRWLTVRLMRTAGTRMGPLRMGFRLVAALSLRVRIGAWLARAFISHPCP